MKNESQSGGQKAFEKGLWCLNKKMHAAAIKKFTEAIKFDPDNAEFYYYRSLCGGSKTIKIDINKAVELNPNSGKFYFIRAGTWGYKSNPDKAISDYTKAIELDPDNVNAYCARAIVYQFFKNEPRKALEDYQKAQLLGYRQNPEWIKMLKEETEAKEKRNR
jgi:tetratricopeptide (TPR) repeat protein